MYIYYLLQCVNKFVRARIYYLKFESDNIICRKQIISVQPHYNVIQYYIHYIYYMNILKCEKIVNEIMLSFAVFKNILFLKMTRLEEKNIFQRTFDKSFAQFLYLYYIYIL